MQDGIELYPHSKFRNINGQRMTSSLFFEQSYHDPSKAIYTLKDIDWKGYRSLYRLYLEEEDLTEYLFANKYFENWSHWLDICNSPWFRDYIERWRTELNLKMEAQALRRIQEESKDKDSKNNFSANKTVLDKLWKENNPTKATARGRPTKDEVRGELNRRANEEQKLQEDFDRIVGS